MDFISVRAITNDVERLATFWERLTGLPVTRPVPVFAELRTPTGTIAIGAPATVGMLGNAGPVPGQNRSVFIELRVDDIDATWKRIDGLVPQTIPEIVLEPTDIVPARTAQAGSLPGNSGRRHGREQDPDPRPPDRRPAAIPAAMSNRDAARAMVTEGFRQLPVADGTGWIGIADIASVCGALPGPPAA